MPKYNLYKIDNSRRVDMLAGFEQKKLIKASSKLLSGYNVEFYLSKEQDEQDIWWVDTYSEFIPPESRATLKNRSHFAALVVYNDTECYVVSLGKTFFYMRDYCMPDFGIDVAERIVDTSRIDIKNSRHFGGAKVKTIDTYRKADLDYDIGEAIFFLKAKTIDEQKWGSSVRCGTSVQFQLDIEPVAFVEKLHEISALLQLPPQISLPRATVVVDPAMIAKLNNSLIDTLVEIETEEDTVMDFSSLSLLGTEFVFWGNQNLSLKMGHGPEMELREGNEILDLLKYVRDRGHSLNLDTLNRIKVVVQTDTERRIQYKVTKIIEFLTEDEEAYYFFAEGRWLRFSRSYIQSLKDSINRIPWEHDSQGFALTRIEEYRNANPDKKLVYREYVFNQDKAIQESYQLGDRDLSYWDGLSVEVSDLIKEGTAYAVKMGKTRTFVDAIDQSLGALRFVQQNNGRYGAQEVTEFGLWLLSENKNPISQLSDFKSLIFLIRLHDWYRNVRLAGFQPRIRIGYLKEA